MDSRRLVKDNGSESVSHFCIASLLTKTVSASSDMVTVVTDKNILVTELAARFHSPCPSLPVLPLYNQEFLSVYSILPNYFSKPLTTISCCFSLKLADVLSVRQT